MQNQKNQKIIYKFEKLVPASKPKYFFSYTRKCSGQNTELGIKKEAYVYPYIYSIHIFRDKSTGKDYFDNPIQEISSGESKYALNFWDIFNLENVR